MGFFFLSYTLIFIYLFKYETMFSRNGLSLEYSERDTSSVKAIFFVNATNVSFGGGSAGK